MQANVERDEVVSRRTLTQRLRPGREADREAEWSATYRVKLYKESSRISADELDPAAVKALANRRARP